MVSFRHIDPYLRKRKGREKRERGRERHRVVDYNVLALSPFITGRMFVRPNILRTLRRTMIRLIELLVRRIRFGQSKLYFILNSLVMRCKLRPELAADRKYRLKSIYFNSTNYYLILGLRDKAAPSTTSQQINKFPPKRVKNLATPSSIFIFTSFTGELCSQPEAMISQYGECSQKMLSEGFWTPNIASTNTSN